MPFDTLATKTLASLAGATTGYPTGPIQVGGASVDEFDMHKTPWDTTVIVIIVGTLTAGTVTPSIETDDNTGFTSATQRALGAPITAAGRYEFGIPYEPERYMRVRCDGVAATAASNITAAWVPRGNNLRQH